MPKFNTKNARASLSKIGRDSIEPLSIIGGMVLAATINKAVERGISRPVAGLLGFDGIDARKIINPVLFATIGIGARQFTNNTIVRNMMTGVAVYGGVKAIGSFSRNPIISLQGPDDEQAPISLPGIGDPDNELLRLPGIGALGAEPELPALEDFQGIDDYSEDFQGIDSVGNTDIEDAQIEGYVDEDGNEINGTSIV